MEEPAQLAEMVAAVRELGARDDFEIVVDHPPGTDPDPWIEAGATWCLTGFGMQPERAEVERAIDAL